MQSSKNIVKTGSPTAAVNSNVRVPTCSVSTATMTKTEKLIEMVRVRPFLYDLKDTDYKNRQKKIETWQEIADEMGTGNGTIWSNKWKGLRDNYGKFKKSSDPCNEQAYKKYKNWPWADRMKFLDDCNFLTSRRITICYGNHLTSEQNADPNYSNVQLFIPEDTAIDDSPLQDPVSDSTDNAPETKNKAIKTDPTNDETRDRKVQNEQQDEQKSLDGVDHFFLSYAQTFKTLPSRMQIMLKLEIATLFSRYELQAQGVTSDSVNNIRRIVPPQIVKSEYEITNTIDDD